MGVSGTSSSALSGDHDTDSWMQSRDASSLDRSLLAGDGPGKGSSSVKRKTYNASLGFLGSGVDFSEDTVSSSSATLSLQLPFSDDETGILNGLGQTFHLAARPGDRDSDGFVNALGLATGQGRGLLEGLQAEAVRARMVELNEELTHLDQSRRALEGKLREERAR